MTGVIHVEGGEVITAAEAAPTDSGTMTQDEQIAKLTAERDALTAQVEANKKPVEDPAKTQQINDLTAEIDALKAQLPTEPSTSGNETYQEVGNVPD